MHIKDHNDAMTFFRNSKQLESNGKWKEFVDEMEFDSMLQQPRTMAQAPIAEDLDPGPLRDEMLKGFDPSQETHEEYLQRINLERPFNAAHGGRSGLQGGQLVRNTVDGSRPGYRGDIEKTKTLNLIKNSTKPLNLGEKQLLYKSYDDLFKNY